MCVCVWYDERWNCACITHIIWHSLRFSLTSSEWDEWKKNEIDTIAEQDIPSGHKMRERERNMHECVWTSNATHALQDFFICQERTHTNTIASIVLMTCVTTHTPQAHSDRHWIFLWLDTRASRTPLMLFRIRRRQYYDICHLVGASVYTRTLQLIHR